MKKPVIKLAKHEIIAAIVPIRGWNNNKHIRILIEDTATGKYRTEYVQEYLNRKYNFSESQRVLFDITAAAMEAFYDSFEIKEEK